jgi:NAD(P)-dependent dehydrogenase (short-subunit alcohol dehydrogenase family)
VSRSAIVTGAGSGIGRATARRLAADGYGVTLADIDGGAAQAAAEGIGGQAVSVMCDVSNEAEVQALVDGHVERCGGLDGMVANAGIPDGHRFAEEQFGTWQRVLDVNLTGVFLCGRAAARVMRPGAAIVNTASTYGEVTEHGAAAYSASKGGVRMLTKSMALELGAAGIRVNAVGPGWIRTGMNPLDDAERVARIEASVPLGRIGTPEDIADVIAFLLSDDARYVSGQTLFVDGGWLTSRE